MSAKARGRLYAALVAAATLAAAFVIATRVHLDPNVATLLPERGAAAALARYARAFGGGDPGLVLVEGDDPAAVEAAASELVAAARDRPAFKNAYDRIPLAPSLPPSAWFLLAGRTQLAALTAALTPAAMHARLHETRALVLAPGSSSLTAWLARDPLRLAQIASAQREAPGDQPLRPDGQLATSDGHARLVVIEPRGNALRSEDARAFVHDADAVLAAVRARYPGVSLRLTGGHAIAAATEALLRRDIAVSSTLALGLASLVFVLSFRVKRALLAVVPPLAAGAVITTACASFFASGLSAIATAFASVVLGVGMDSGVHVYAAVQHAIASGSKDPAADARTLTARPVLGAALVAASAFACLALSQISAVRQLGILSATGELVTAFTILALTPAAAAWLERLRKAPVPTRSPAWATYVAQLSRTGRARAVTIATWVLPFIVLALFGMPHAVVGLTSIRPEGLPPLSTYDAIAARFGLANTLPWVVVVRDADRERARFRSDAVAEAIATSAVDLGSVDALTSWSPSQGTRAQRRTLRDAVDLPARAADLEQALRDEGFSLSAFREALDDFRSPSNDADTALIEAALLPRYVAHLDNETLVAMYVRPVPGREDALRALVQTTDAQAELTGYPSLEPALRASLASDLPRAGGLALALLVASLGLTLRRGREVVVAALVVTCEIAAVLAMMRIFGIPLHVYDALVLPVLVGITIDEVLFVVFATRDGDASQALAHEAPVLMATALTTAAGFAALGACRFAALRHIGFVGAVGSVVGVVLALTLVPVLVQPRRRLV